VAENLQVLEEWAGALLSKLEPKERRQLNLGIARKLRRNQQRRIAAQKNPEGTPYAPRKDRQHLRSKRGRVKQKMFTKLRQVRHLKQQSDANSIALAFLGRTARLARVHQYGLRDRPGPNAPDVQYSARELLGFTNADLDMIRDDLLDHLAR